MFGPFTRARGAVQSRLLPVWYEVAVVYRRVLRGRMIVCCDGDVHAEGGGGADKGAPQRQH